MRSWQCGELPRRWNGALVLPALATVLASLLLLPVTSAQPLRPLGSSTLPPGSTATLTPTFPTHTGVVPTTAVGQSASFDMRVAAACGNPCWVDQGYPVDIFLVPANQEGAVDHCSQSAAALKLNDHGYAQSDSSTGTLVFQGSFNWPAAATSTAHGTPWYAACVHVEVPSNTPFTAHPDYVTGAVADMGTNYVYKVINNHLPTVTLSSRALWHGQMLTITGHSWIPVYSDVAETRVGMSIRQFPAPYTIIQYAFKGATVNASGSWTLSFPMTADYPLGQYYACGGSTRYIYPCSGFKIVKRPPPTPTPAPTARPTATAQASPSATPTTDAGTTTPSASSTPAAAVGDTGPNGHDGGGLPWLLLLGIVTVLVLGAAGGLSWYARRSRAALPLT